MLREQVQLSMMRRRQKEVSHDDTWHRQMCVVGLDARSTASCKNMGEKQISELDDSCQTAAISLDSRGRRLFDLSGKLVSPDVVSWTARRHIVLITSFPRVGCLA